MIPRRKWNEMNVDVNITAVAPRPHAMACAEWKRNAVAPGKKARDARRHLTAAQKHTLQHTSLPELYRMAMNVPTGNLGQHMNETGKYLSIDNKIAVKKNYKDAATQDLQIAVKKIYKDAATQDFQIALKKICKDAATQVDAEFLAAAAEGARAESAKRHRADAEAVIDLTADDFEQFEPSNVWYPPVNDAVAAAHYLKQCEGSGSVSSA